ncbi:hypothetical protein MKW98_021329, partial [Papaver atlanticum]
KPLLLFYLDLLAFIMDVEGEEEGLKSTETNVTLISLVMSWNYEAQKGNSLKEPVLCKVEAESYEVHKEWENRVAEGGEVLKRMLCRVTC